MHQKGHSRVWSDWRVIALWEPDSINEYKQKNDIKNVAGLYSDLNVFRDTHKRYMGYMNTHFISSDEHWKI